jgi:PAS domain S-box-containing protein
MPELALDTRRGSAPERPALRWARAAAATAAALGILALLGWATGWLRLAALANERIPMAPSTALLFLVFGAALLLVSRRAGAGHVSRTLVVSVSAATLLALALLLASSRGSHLELEHFGIRHTTSADGVPVGHISPVTAALFLLSGAAVLFLLFLPAGRKRRSLLPALVGGVVTLAGLVLAMAYLLGEPLLYGGTFIPPALSTSLAFVALGVALLLLSIDRARPGDPAPDPPGRRAATLFLWILVVATAGVVAAAHAYFTRYEQRFRTSVMESLGAIAELKVHELALWRQERLGDAMILRDNGAFIDLARRLLDSPHDLEARERLRSWLDSLQSSYGYLRVSLLDAEGHERLAGRDRPAAIAPHVARDALVALRSDEIVFLDLHRDAPGSEPRLALVVPLRDDAGGADRALGAVLLAIDPEQYLYPMLRRWPTPSRTAETLLVRRDGDEVLFLSDLKFRDGTALNLRFPLAQEHLPAAIAARGFEGEIEGIDYRGHRVVAALRAVPGSPWHLVARIDAAEALAPARERLWSLVALLAALLFGAVAALTAVWQRNAKAHYRQLAGAHEALARSESTLRTIFDSVADGIVIADASTHRVVRANAAFLRMLGYRTEDLAGLTVEDLHPAAEVQKAMAAFERLLRGEILVAPDLSVRRADGTLFVAAISAAALSLEGRPHLLGVFHDVSERKSAETRIAYLNSVLRAIRNVNQLITREKDRDRLIQRACDLLVEARGFGAVAIGLTDEAGGRILASASAGQRQDRLRDGGDPEAPPVCAREAMARADIVICRASERAADGDPAAPESGVAEDVVALPLLQEGKRYGFVLASLAAGMSGDPEELDLLGEAVGDIAFALRTMEVEAARDHSLAELSDRDAQLRQTQKMEAIGRLAGGVAHDFNNLLMVILGYCESLLQGLERTDPLRGDAEEISRAGHRAAHLTRQLLAFSRAQALQPVVLDLNASVANMEAMLRRLIGEDIELVTQLAAGLGHVEADPGQLEQVVMNLALNARDAMPQGGHLSLATADVELDQEFARHHLDAPAGSYVQLTVSDSGCGMDEATRQRIFEPFFTTKPTGSGTGLGLATVYGIVKQSRGSIWVYSEVGRGTTIRIYLPRASGTPQVEPPALAARPAHGAGEHLLVVEDEPALRTLLRTMLANLGYRVTLAADGREALVAVEEQGLRPDLLLTDVVMPGMSGPLLAERLRRAHPELKVLFMSGYTDDALGHHGVLDPGTVLLQKPFGSADLASRLRAVLD